MSEELSNKTEDDIYEKHLDKQIELIKQRRKLAGWWIIGVPVVSMITYAALPVIHASSVAMKSRIEAKSRIEREELQIKEIAKKDQRVALEIELKAKRLTVLRKDDEIRSAENAAYVNALNARTTKEDTYHEFVRNNRMKKTPRWLVINRNGKIERFKLIGSTESIEGGIRFYTPEGIRTFVWYNPKKGHHHDILPIK